MQGILCKIALQPKRRHLLMRIRFYALCILSFICTFQAFSQKNTPKFGKISPADFAPTIYSIDSNASAVVLAEIGSTEMVGNSKGGFSLVFKTFRRVHILNKNGYDAAEEEIRLYNTSTSEEELNSLKASTYNLVNGKVVEAKLDKASIYKEKLSKNWSARKFTFPDLREGCIIEYEYKITSDFIFNLRGWYFQSDLPCLWSEYKVSIPEFYNYVHMTQGYHPYVVRESKQRHDNFQVTDYSGAQSTDRSTFGAFVNDYRYAMENIPALKEENFTSTLGNHIAKIEFQLSELRHPFTPRNIMGTWQTVTGELLKDEDFGLALGKDNGWLNNTVEDAMGNATDNLEKAKRIFKYVRDNFTATYSSYMLEKSLKSILKAKTGNVAEVNLLLVAMLRKAGFDARPVMLSTRSHGFVYSLYPLMDRFNYVISQVYIDGKTYHLDASKPLLGFGSLTSDCYNGHARVIDDQATPLEFNADSLLERKVSSVIIINTDKGYAGSMQQTAGPNESYSLRSRIREQGPENYFQALSKSYSHELELSEAGIDSLRRFEDPVNIHYNFNMKLDNEDILYINPMMTEGYKENPFKSATRLYPVEMPYTKDEVYLLRMEVPKGYEVDELPKQVIVKLNEDEDGIFEYRISNSNGVISMRSRLQLKRTVYAPDEYDMLRDFFNMVVKKHNEQIVFKKKAN